MKPNSILGIYLIKQIILSFIAVLAVVLGIIFMFEVIELLRRISSRPDVGFDFVMKMALTKMPRTMEMIFPFIIMLAAMITFWKVSKFNEFVIIRASGVSIWGFLAPVMFATFLIGIVNVAVLNPVSAYMYEVHETLDYRFKTRIPDAVLFNFKGLWIRESLDKDKHNVLQAKNIRQEGEELLLRDVTILEMDKESQIIRRIEAFVAVLKQDKTFELKDVKIYIAGKPTEILASMNYKTNLTIERIKENFAEPEAISFWKLRDTIKFYESSGFSAKKHYMRYLSLIASPFLFCAMVLVAAIFSLRPNSRKGGVMLMIVGGISIGFSVYFLTQVVYAFGLNDYIPSMFAAWAPTLIVSLVAITVLLHLEDG